MGGRRAGVWTAAVLTGTQGRPTLQGAKPHFLLDSVAEIPALLPEHEPSELEVPSDRPQAVVKMDAARDVPPEAPADDEAGEPDNVELPTVSVVAGDEGLAKEASAQDDKKISRAEGPAKDSRW